LSIESIELPPCDFLEFISAESSILQFSNRKTCRLHIADYSCKRISGNLCDQDWPCLEVLTAPVFLISKLQAGFPHLREINLEDMGTEGSVTEFFCQVALHPDLCPVLEALSIDECPEWDIFFIMLERRLFLGADRATAFKSITFSFGTPLSILPHIHEILQGRLPNRPSNFDLSRISKVTTLLDRTVYVRIGSSLENQGLTSLLQAGLCRLY
ncbi:11443_t:CDS:1, partial [Acaulospora colombiana]